MKGGMEMSVRVPDRNESKVEFLGNFHRLRKEVEEILMRDFGLKRRRYEVALMEEIYEIADEDKAAFEGLCGKYGIESFVVDKYPAWLVESWRRRILEILDNIGAELESANSIYALLPDEWIERRLHWDRALGWCNALKDKLQDIVYRTGGDVSLGAHRKASEMLSKEMNLIKGVRKSDYGRNKGVR